MARRPADRPLDLAAAVYVEIASLNPWPDNPRDLTDSVPVIARSLRAFGFGRPLIAWGSEGLRRVIVGHGVREAYLKLLAEDPTWIPAGVPARGLVPVRWRDDWTEAEATGYALADNRTAEFSLWDDAKLSSVVRGLDDVRFPGLESLGWDAEDLAAILAPPVPEPAPTPATRTGGNHGGGGAPADPPGVNVTYSLVFDDEPQKERWVRFVRWLRGNQQGETNAARLDAFLRSHVAELG